MRVSVCIPTHQRAGLLARALEALVHQRVGSELDWEIVVANNNCTDDTPRVVSQYAERAIVPVSQVFEARPGVSYARNAAIAVATGEILAFIDDDIRPEASWLAAALNALECEGADLVGGRILPEWEAPPPAWLSANDELYDYLGLMAMSERRRLTYPFADRPRIWGGSMMVRRSTLDRVGVFNVSLGRIGAGLRHGEESDLIRRVLQAGLVVVYDPAILVYHWVPRERMRRRYFWRWVFGYAEGKAFYGGPRPAGASRLGFPRWMYRSLLRQGLRLAGAPLSLRRQIDFFWELGLMVGWHKRAQVERSATR
jgi:glycosyltransferase involved in cell wall biosynthesis